MVGVDRGGGRGRGWWWWFRRLKGRRVTVQARTCGATNLGLQDTSGQVPVRGLCIVTGQYYSLCGCALGFILGGFDIVEDDVQDREQVDSGEQVEARERDRGRRQNKETTNERSNM